MLWALVYNYFFFLFIKLLCMRTRIIYFTCTDPLLIRVQWFGIIVYDQFQLTTFMTACHILSLVFFSITYPLGDNTKSIINNMIKDPLGIGTQIFINRLSKGIHWGVPVPRFQQGIILVCCLSCRSIDISETIWQPCKSMIILF